MKRQLLVSALLCFLLAQLLAWWTWSMRPAANYETILLGQDSEGSQANLNELFVELEPGEFAGTLLLGGMRGLVADLMWLRALESKKAGRYYESVALFGFISKLQPRFDRVWEFMAHDLAYNIAFEMDSSDEKWQWFLAGAQAAARGIERNPQSTRLMTFLAWMFTHKGETLIEQVERHDWDHILAVLRHRFPTAVPEPIDVEVIDAELIEGEWRIVLDGTSLQPFSECNMYDPDGLWAQLLVTSINDGLAQCEVRWVADRPFAAEQVVIKQQWNPFTLGEVLYRCTVDLRQRQGSIFLDYAARFVAISQAKNAHRLRNRGEHLAAFDQYVLALKEWAAVREIFEDDSLWNDTAHDRDVRQASIDSYRLHESSLRLQLGQLARRLLGDEAMVKQVQRAILNRDWQAIARLRSTMSWKRSAIGSAGVEWYEAGTELR